MVTYVVLAKFTDPGESGMRSSFSAGAFVCPESPIEAVGSAVIIHATLTVRQ